MSLKYEPVCVVHRVPEPLHLVQEKNNYFTEMCSSSEAGSYVRLIAFVYHSTLGLRVIKKKKSSGEGS